MNTYNLRTSKATVPILLLAVALLFAACGDDDTFAPQSDQASPATGAPVTAAPRAKADQQNMTIDAAVSVSEVSTAPQAPPSDAGETDLLGSGAVELAALQAPSLGRDVIFRADLTVAVTDVATAGSQTTTVVNSLGGFLFGQQTTGGNRPLSVLTFKILPDNFQAALDALGSIGEIRNQNVFADDVTERVVDLQSRIATSEASVDRLRTFLEEAPNIKTIIDLERELNTREAALESQRGQLRTIQGQVALATIIVTLTESDVAPAFALSVTSYIGREDAGRSCPAQAETAFTEGDEVTVCFDIFNNGESSLTGFTLRDTVLDVELNDLTVVVGDPNLLEPGQNLVMSTGLTVDRQVRTQTRVTAEAIKDETGEVIPGRTVSQTQVAFLIVEDAGGLPGFGETLSASWGVLKDLGSVSLVVVAAIIPFLWLVPLAIVLGVWQRRRTARRREKARARIASGRSAAPPPTKTPAAADLPDPPDGPDVPDPPATAGAQDEASAGKDAG